MSRTRVRLGEVADGVVVPFPNDDNGLERQIGASARIESIGLSGAMSNPHAAAFAELRQRLVKVQAEVASIVAALDRLTGPPKALPIADVVKFMQSCTVADTGAMLAAGVLYRLYVRWCEARGDGLSARQYSFAVSRLRAIRGSRQIACSTWVVCQMRASSC
jgi:hypothetical protein